MKVCFSCKKELDIEGKPGRADTCDFCDADLKVCLNCRFYNQSAPNECDEPMADKVLDKDRANFCDYFEFKETKTEEAVKKEDALNKLKELFGDK